MMTIRMRMVSVGALLCLMWMASATFVYSQETLETPELGELSVQIAPAPIDAPLLPNVPTATLTRSVVPIPTAPVPEPPIEGVLPDPAPQTSISMDGLSRSLYVTGEVGTVNLNSVLGDVQVFRLGDGPQYRFGFNHFRADGLDFQEPGTGYFRQNNVLNGWVSVPLEPIRLEVEAEYRDRQIGLQGKPVYYAANFRGLTSQVTGTFTPSDTFRVRGTLPVTQETQVLSVRENPEETDGDIAPANSLVYTNPEIELRFDLPRLQVTTGAYYTGLIATDLPSDGSHRIGLGLGLEGVLRRGMTVFGRFDTQYRFGDIAYFPFSLGLNGSLTDRWSVSIEGGGDVVPYDPTRLWDIAPVTPPEYLPTGRAPYDQQWYAQSNIGWALVPDVLRLGAGGEFRHHRALPYTTGYTEEDDGSGITQAGFQVDFAEHTEVSSTLETEFSPAEWLSTTLVWNASWLDRLPYQTAHRFGWNTEFRRDPWSVTSSVSMPIFDQLVLPTVTVEGEALLGDDLRLRLFVRDAFSAFLDGGRTIYGDEVNEDFPFIGTGFEAGVSVRVTF